MSSIVCLCGSMRFEQEIAEVAREESVAGRIVVLPLCNMKRPHPLWSSAEDAERVKAALDDLHFAKIDLADEVVVVSDASGYIGDSTRREIAYAERLGTPVRYERRSLPSPGEAQQELAVILLDEAVRADQANLATSSALRALVTATLGHCGEDVVAHVQDAITVIKATRERAELLEVKLATFSAERGVELAALHESARRAVEAAEAAARQARGSRLAWMEKCAAIDAQHRPYVPGDRVSVGGHAGVVVERPVRILVRLDGSDCETEYDPVDVYPERLHGEDKRPVLLAPGEAISDVKEGGQ